MLRMAILYRFSGGLLFFLLLFHFLVEGMAQPDEPKPPSDVQKITVIGLGNMGTAVAECLAKQDQYQVHVWNRTPKAVQGDLLVHSDVTAAVHSAPTILLFVDDWSATKELLERLRHTLIGKKIVVFSTYTPSDIESVQNMDGLIGGALVGVPETVCTPQALVVTSSPVEALNVVGRTVALEGNRSGLASLINMCLIWAIHFGIAGHELAHLALQRYGAADAVVETYSELAVSVGTKLTAQLLPAVSISFRQDDFASRYVPVGVLRKVCAMEIAYLKNSLGITSTFLDAYLESLKKVPNERDGPVAWTQHLEDAVVEPEL